MKFSVLGDCSNKPLGGVCSIQLSYWDICILRTIQLRSIRYPSIDCLHIVQCFAVLVKFARRPERQAGAFCLSAFYRMQRKAEAEEHTPEPSAFLQKLICFRVRECGEHPNLV